MNTEQMAYQCASSVQIKTLKPHYILVRNKKMKNQRLLNAIFEDENFLVDDESIGYIVRDIINMNWWNTCGYLLGYRKNRRVSLDVPTQDMKLVALLLKEYYRVSNIKLKNEAAFRKEIVDYIEGDLKYLRQLKIWSIEYRRNYSQYFYKDGKPTWFDCTSRATYAWKYVGQNGYIDFDGVCRVEDGQKLIDHCLHESVYPHRDYACRLFSHGVNQVKKEIFSQRKKQFTVQQWIDALGINITPSRKWLFDKIAQVKTDPYKNNEKLLLRQGLLIGNNELLYGYKTMASTGDIMSSKESHVSRASCASDASHASHASNASRASDASHASDASRASNASHASNASNASCASDANVTTTPEEKNAQTWFTVPAAIGKIDGLDHPPVFLRKKYGVAGHWKIDKDVFGLSKLAVFDPFMGWGETLLYSKKIWKNFVGVEINPETMNGYILPIIQDTINGCGNADVKVEARLGDSCIFCPDLVGKFDLCYTSPPYFDFEDYGFHNKIIQECIDYDQYHERVTKKVFSHVHKYLIDDGVLALQTEKDKKLKQKWIDAILPLGYSLVKDTITGQEKIKYSVLSKRDQTLLIFKKVKS